MICLKKYMKELLTYLGIWSLLAFGIFTRLKLQPRKWFLTKTIYITELSEETLWKLLVTNRCLAYLHCLSCFSGCLLLVNYPNINCSNILLKSSITYYLYDSLYNSLVEYSLMYQIHHISTIFLLFNCLHYPFFLNPCLKGLLLAETSSLLLIPWETSGKLGWKQMRRALSTPTMYLYIIVRTLMLPSFIIYQLPTIYNYLSNKLTAFFLCYSLILIGLGSIVWTGTIIRKCLIPNKYTKSKTIGKLTNIA